MWIGQLTCKSIWNWAVFTLTPSTLWNEAGNATMLTGSSITVSDNKWAMQGGEITPIDMALKITTFAGSHYNIDNFGDGALLIQAWCFLFKTWIR